MKKAGDHFSTHIPQNIEMEIILSNVSFINHIKNRVRRRREEENISTTSILKKKIIKAEKNAMPHTVMVNLTISHFV